MASAIEMKCTPVLTQRPSHAAKNRGGSNYILVYNLNTLVSFPLTAWTAYVLLRHLSGAPRLLCVMTALTMAFALHLLQRLLPARVYPIVLLLILIGLVIEFVAPNGNRDADKNIVQQLLNGESGSRLDWTDPYKPSAVYDWLDSLPDDTVVFHYPFEAEGAIEKYFAVLPHYNQPMINGVGSFIPEWVDEVDWDGFPSTEMLLYLLRRVQYVLAHFDLLAPEAQEQKRAEIA